MSISSLASNIGPSFGSTHCAETNLSEGDYIGVVIADTKHRQLMLDAISPLARVRVFQAFQQVQASISGGSLAGLVCECRDAYGDLLVRLAEKPQVPPVPTLVILRPVESDIISFTKMVRSGWPALARVAGESRGAEEVRAVVQHHWSPEASAPIVHRLFERSQLQPDVLLVIAMISGSKRLSVGAFARVAQLSERTLEDDWPLHDSRARVGSWLGRLCFTQYGDLKCPGNG